MTTRDSGAHREPTRNDVARLAGVSTAVVSYVVNDGPRPVAAATRARVLDAIDKLGYRPNTAARSLITGRSGLVGLIVPDVENPYFAALAKAVEIAAAARGVRLVLGQSLSGGFLELLDSLAGHQVDGILTATLPPAAFLTDHWIGRVPLVVVSLALSASPVPVLYPDYRAGARTGVGHLVEVHGRRTVALVTGSDGMDEREIGWREALAVSGLSPGPIVRIPWSAQGGAQGADELADRHPEVDAIFVTSDQQAVGLLAGLHRRGRRVPDDLAVVSFDGSLAGEFTIPGLTTVAVPFADLAVAALDALVADLPQDRVFPLGLVVRESCGCGRDGGQSTASTR
ncbi:MAG: LacI family DNA-binding transcriptional regulator [Propionibacterium sp.]|nr:LacI family DNA-binding transcriptional regulator [Propionibacterium sp.]